MKKIIEKSTLFILALLVVICTAPRVSAESQGIKRKFLVSAYYSPLPDQRYYLRGNYEAEIRLNGNGTHGADGTPVYVGMIAAPKSYPFGTQIEIPGLGIGTVHDRGGAIIARDEYDRIDVWMGYGEEGLARALAWGMRTVEGTILNNTDAITADLAFNHIAPADISGLPPATFSTPLSEGGTGAEVEKLQKSLAELGFYQGEITGVFGEQTEKALFDFQAAQGILKSVKDTGAGYFGPKTRQALAQALTAEKERKIAEAQVFKRLFPAGLQKGADGEDVRRLQIALKELGHLDAQATGYFGEQTASAVLAFQIEQKLVGSARDSGAGIFGPKTQKALTDILGERRAQIAAFEPEIKIITFAGDPTKKGKTAASAYNPGKVPDVQIVKIDR